MMGSRKMQEKIWRVCNQGLSTRGRGGHQLPLLCSLVLDEVKQGLSENGCFTMGLS